MVGTSKSTAAHMWSILYLENLPNIECSFENDKSNLMFHRPSQKVDSELVGVEDLPEGADKESAIKLSDNIKTCLLNLLIKKPNLSAFKSCGVILYKSESDIKILDADNPDFIKVLDLKTHDGNEILISPSRQQQFIDRFGAPAEEIFRQR